MHTPVFLTNDAKRDLEELYEYIQTYDSPGKADAVLTQIEQALSRLSDFPERGNYPKELLALGMRSHREIHLKAYRIIYKLDSGKVYVVLIVDGRRDMQSLLLRRLLEG